MSRRQFENIVTYLTHSKDHLSSFVDKFWEVREMLEFFNKYVAKTFMPSWVSYLDKSMSP